MIMGKKVGDQVFHELLLTLFKFEENGQEVKKQIENK